jgi:thiol-disulfide isomerase/thioredoxin
MQAMRIAVAVGLLLSLARAAPAAEMPPQMDASGQEAYKAFLTAEGHKAFAIAPGGRWGWAGAALSARHAADQALATCQEQVEQRCILYAVDDDKVFDTKAWPGLWGPYADAQVAAKARIGLQRGMRFPNLSLTDAKGRPVTLSDLRGNVLVLHFWGSWCGVCRKEMPDMQRAAARVGPGVRFALVQVREPVAESSKWLRKQAIKLPLYDSGMRSSDDSSLRLADGGRLSDRELAKAFPSTYVLDRHGLVLFSHTGAIHGWSEYIPFLNDAARAGK